MKILFTSLLLVTSIVLAEDFNLTPDGEWVQGQPTLTPDGKWVGSSNGETTMDPDGNWVGVYDTSSKSDYDDYYLEDYTLEKY